MELMQREIKYLEGCHDPDNDQSRVSWVDVRKLSLIKDLLLKVAALEEKVEALENPAEYPPGRHDEKRSEWSGELFSY